MVFSDSLRSKLILCKSAHVVVFVFNLEEVLDKGWKILGPAGHNIDKLMGLRFEQLWPKIISKC